MICLKCGRELRDDSTVCKGCGTCVTRPKKAKIAKLSKIMQSSAIIGGIKVWQLCIVLFCAVALLSTASLTLPGIIGNISSPSDVTGSDVQTPGGQAPTQQLATVTKLGWTLRVNPGEGAVKVEDVAYEDGSCHEEYMIDDAVRVRILRSAMDPNGVNGHVFSLFPNLIEQPEFFDETFSLGEYPVIRAQVPAVINPDNSVIDILFVQAQGFDHLLIIETPNDRFVSYENRIEEIINTLTLVEITTVSSPTDIIM